MKQIAAFLPLLVLYAVVVVLFSSSTFQGDEGRYVELAKNLLHGSYSPAGSVSIPNGPGYPLVLLPFVALQVPLIAAKLLNALLLFLAIVYFFRTLLYFIPERPARVLTFVVGLYPPFFRLLHLIMTETLTVFLICGLAYHFVAAHRQEGRRRNLQVGLTGFFLGYLALTKVFFGFILVACLLLSAILFIWKRIDLLRHCVLASSLALLICVPYLVYTYSLTGKVFYWSSIGGGSLYWISSPYAGELGDWQGNRLDQIENSDRQGDSVGLVKNHGRFFEELSGVDEVSADQRLRAEGLRNIVHQPAKFVLNWVANCGRLLFGYPNSFTPQKLSTYFYLLPNMLLVGLATFCLFAGWLGRKRIPSEIMALLTFGSISLLGSSVLSAYSRQFTPLVPIFVTWIAVTFDRVVRLEILR